MWESRVKGVLKGDIIRTGHWLTSPYHSHHLYPTYPTMSEAFDSFYHDSPQIEADWPTTVLTHLAPERLQVVGPVLGPSSSSTIKKDEKKKKRKEQAAPYRKDPSFNRQGHKKSRHQPHFPYPLQSLVDRQSDSLHHNERFEDLFVQDLVNWIFIRSLS